MELEQLMNKIAGQCLCTSIRYDFKSSDLIAYQCHCKICQRITGTAFSTTLFAKEKFFKWMSGENLIQSYTRDSGYVVNFCTYCSSPVPNKFRNYALYSIPVGGIVEHQHEIKIAVQLFLNSKATWDTDKLQGKCYEEMPNLHEMLKYLQLVNT